MFQARRPVAVCGCTLIPNKQQSRWRKACLTKINDDPRGVVLFNLVAAGGVVLACWPHMLGVGEWTNTVSVVLKGAPVALRVWGGLGFQPYTLATRMIIIECRGLAQAFYRGVSAPRVTGFITC